jgi:hypothetical protein
LEIDLYQIHPSRYLEFFLSFEKVDEVCLDYMGKDVYELNYIWSHGSREFHESQWRDINTGREVKMPAARVGVVRFAGDSDDYSMTFTMRPNRAMAQEQRAQVVRVISIKSGFSFLAKNDEFTRRALPRRDY